MSPKDRPVFLAEPFRRDPLVFFDVNANRVERRVEASDLGINLGFAGVVPMNFEDLGPKQHRWPDRHSRRHRYPAFDQHVAHENL